MVTQLKIHIYILLEVVREIPRWNLYHSLCYSLYYSLCYSLHYSLYYSLHYSICYSLYYSLYYSQYYSTELVAYYVTVLSPGLHGLYFLLYTYDYLYFILFSFQIVSSFVRDSSYHDMYYKGCGLLCAHKKSFNTAIPVRSLGPYMCVHYCTYIVHILV